MPTPPTIIGLDQIAPIPGPDTLTWLPVRHTLGIRAFGANAYVAARAGDDVVELHDELPDPDEDRTLAHEELYFVARGHATFQIDGERHEAPAGTYVFVPDPASQRHAVAGEAGTTVLSFGGPPTFVASAWEWAFRAAPLIASDPQRARAILTDGLAAHPHSARLHFSLACVEAVGGDDEAALRRLRRTIELWPPAREIAREDEDLASLRGDPRFQALVAPADG